MACAGPIMYDYAGMQKQITDYWLNYWADNLSILCQWRCQLD